MISLLLLNNFYTVMSYRRVQKKKKATNYCIRFGHSLWSAKPAQGVDGRPLKSIHTRVISASFNFV